MNKVEFVEFKDQMKEINLPEGVTVKVDDRIEMYKGRFGGLVFREILMGVRKDFPEFYWQIGTDKFLSRNELVNLKSILKRKKLFLH